jgi:hypothetical protein
VLLMKNTTLALSLKLNVRYCAVARVVCHVTELLILDALKYR